jgi:hypothetical protein
MASFPFLRPSACSASAECRAVHSSGWLVGLLTACAVLRDIAFVAVSELATLRGKKAFEASVFPTRESRSRAFAFSLVGAPTAEARRA